MALRSLGFPPGIPLSFIIVDSVIPSIIKVFSNSKKNLSVNPRRFCSPQYRIYFFTLLVESNFINICKIINLSCQTSCSESFLASTPKYPKQLLGKNVCGNMEKAPDSHIVFLLRLDVPKVLRGFWFIGFV